MRKVRRTDREISDDEARAILERGEYGVLSTVGADGQPYGVPLSYVFENDSIYFHCALSGHKLDDIAGNPKVSFCVVGGTKVLPEKFATEYESVIAFGSAAEVAGEERQTALLRILDKYCLHFIEEGKEYIGQKNQAMKVYKIVASHISGKARR